MKRESFLKGTILLMCANAISKILGAALKIPLAYILSEEGMAIYQTAFSVYIMLLSFITSGMPFAISKYISEELVKGNHGNIRFTVRSCIIIMSLLGITISAAMYFGADYFALAMKDPKAPLAICAIAPSVFFVAVGAVYKSCYQGYSNMTPTALSQIIEAFIKLAAGYSLAMFFSAFSTTYSSAAAIFGVTVGEAFATLILFLLYTPYRRELSHTTAESGRRNVLKTLFSVAIPMTAASVISGSLSLAETSVIRGCLTGVRFTEISALQFLRQYGRYTHLFDDLLIEKRLSFDGARWLFGAYSGYAMTVLNLPIGILSAFCVSVLPLITRCITLCDHGGLNRCMASAVRISLIISTPCAVIMMIFSKEILNILFKNTASAIMLSSAAPLVVIICVSQLVCSALYASGKIITPFIFTLISLVVKILLSFILINIPELNILGAIFASYIADILQLILICRSVKKELGIHTINIVSFIKIVFCAGLSGFCARLFYKPILSVLNSTIASFIASAVFFGTCYLLLIFLSNVLKKEELALLKKTH